jgi:hypothetical protein
MTQRNDRMIDLDDIILLRIAKTDLTRSQEVAMTCASNECVTLRRMLVVKITHLLKSEDLIFVIPKVMVGIAPCLDIFSFLNCQKFFKNIVHSHQLPWYDKVDL